jgi:hypothetical protein
MTQEQLMRARRLARDVIGTRTEEARELADLIEQCNERCCECVWASKLVDVLRGGY